MTASTPPPPRGSARTTCGRCGVARRWRASPSAWGSPSLAVGWWVGTARVGSGARRRAGRRRGRDARSAASPATCSARSSRSSSARPRRRLRPRAPPPDLVELMVTQVQPTRVARRVMPSTRSSSPSAKREPAVARRRPNASPGTKATLAWSRTRSASSSVLLRRDAADRTAEQPGRGRGRRRTHPAARCR